MRAEESNPIINFASPLQSNFTCTYVYLFKGVTASGVYKTTQIVWHFIEMANSIFLLMCEAAAYECRHI